jgi:4'-phosphopantetheinyl transferase
VQGEGPWGPPPAELTLTAGEVHLWRASLHLLPSVLARLAGTLSEEELSRARRFRFAVHRDRFIAGRGAQREILARYLGTAPEALRFREAEHGKPMLDGIPAEAGIRFNASNSELLALYAVTRHREVGVDLEHLRPVPDWEAIAERFFSPLENRAVRALPPELREEAFFRCWTRKEAYIKALGTGLFTPLDGFAEEAARWTLREVCPGPGYVGAVVMEGAVRELACFEWCVPE